MEVSCGLFGMAKILSEDFEKGMRDLAEIGFTAVEPVVTLSESDLFPAELPEYVKSVLWNKEKVLNVQKIIKPLGMEISSAHISLGLAVGYGSMDEFIDNLIKFSIKTGIKYFITSTRFTTKKDCEDLAEIFNDLMNRLNPYDITVYYHNHESEMRYFSINGQLMMGIEYFMALTNSNVKIQFDTGWALFGNCNPISFMKKYSERIASIHLKDINFNYYEADMSSLFAAIGSGILPVKEIVKLSECMKLIPHGLMIDQDGPSQGNSLIDDLQKGMTYITQVSKT